MVLKIVMEVRDPSRWGNQFGSARPFSLESPPQTLLHLLASTLDNEDPRLEDPTRVDAARASQSILLSAWIWGFANLKAARQYGENFLKYERYTCINL
jgi:hypothetical protein